VTLFSVRNSGRPKVRAVLDCSDSDTISQPHRRARIGRRQSFVLLLQQNHNGLKLPKETSTVRRSYVQIWPFTSKTSLFILRFTGKSL